MKLTRSTALCCLALAPWLLLSCSGNESADEEAEVVISIDLREAIDEIDMAAGQDLRVPRMELQSQPKSAERELTAQQDVNLYEWVITPTRADGGTVASPQAKYFNTAYVPAGGTANLQNYPIFPAEYFLRQPLLNLHPDYGGVDPETGQNVIRQRLEIKIYGKQVSGRRVVSQPANITVTFFYSGAAPAGQ